MREAQARSRCFRFADACPAWIQMDTDRYSTVVYSTRQNPACWLVPSFLPGAALTLATWAPDPCSPKPASPPACLAPTHDVTGKACHFTQVTFPVSAGQQSQKGKVGKPGKAQKADPDSCTEYVPQRVYMIVIFFFSFSSAPLHFASATEGGSNQIRLVPILSEVGSSPVRSSSASQSVSCFAICLEPQFLSTP